jgi:predicted PurR-regulated permease PerM
MAGPIITSVTEPPERRRVERRGNSRLGDLTLPEVRRILITTALGAIVLALFFWMVKGVVVAAILGLIIGFYIRPLHLRLLGRVHNRNLSAIVTLLLVIAPVLVVLAYSYSELADVVGYAATHQQEIVEKVNAAISAALRDETARSRLMAAGFEPDPTTPAEFAAKIAHERTVLTESIRSWQRSARR